MQQGICSEDLRFTIHVNQVREGGATPQMRVCL